MQPEILTHFQNPQEEKPGQWMCKCPSHVDGKNSLSVSVKSDGTVLLKCLANCATGDVLAAVGLKLRDLFPATQNGKGTKAPIVAYYDYRDETKMLLHQTIRRADKSFSQRTPKPDGSWEWKLNGCRRVLYHLPQLLAADPSATVFIGEGEKDADNLAGLGLISTTNVGGAGKWRDDYSDALKGRHVVILPDADKPGRDHAQQVAASLAGKAASIKILELPGLPDKGDVSDWIIAGGTKEKLIELAQGAPEWKPAAGDDAPTQGRSRKRRTPPPDDNDPLSPFHPEGQTDLANARRLVKMHGDEIRYCFPWKKWIVWDGKRWKFDDTGAIERLAKDVSDLIFRAALAIDDLETMRFAVKSASAKGIKAMLDLATSERGIPVLPRDLDRDVWLFNCENGTLDTRTGKLYAARKEDLITKLCPTRFNPDAASHTFETAVDLICGGSQPLIDFIRQLFGYALTGDVREQIVSIFHGVGSNGKSTLVEIILSVMGSDYGCKAPPELLLLKKNDSHPCERADLHGKRLVVCVETPDGRKFNETLLKELSGGDTIKARRLYENFWEFPPTHKAVVCTNHKPEVTGTDHGFWRRIALVPFGVTFWDQEKGESGPPELKGDKGLKDKILTEREGVLAWLVSGCLEWKRKGLVLPVEVRAATAAYRAAEDVVQSFIDECCIVSPMCKQRATPLYDAFKKWSDQSGQEAMKQKRFGDTLTGKGFKRDKSNGVWYAGIGLSQTDGDN